MTSWYKMLKLVTAKRCNTHFVIAERKKNVKTHKKKPKPNVYALNMTIQTEVSSICAKTNCSRSNTETNLASGAHTENFQKKIFLPTRTVNFLKQKIQPIRRHQNIGCFTQNGVAETHRTAKPTDTNNFTHRPEN